MKAILLNNILPEETNTRIIQELCNHQWNIATDNKKNRFEKIFLKKNSGFSTETFKDGKVIVDSVLNFYACIIFDIIKEKLKIKAEIYRVYWNMYLKEAETELHTDSKLNGYKSIIYNLHTTDGGTEIENVFYPDLIGQAKIFNSNLLHRGVSIIKDNVRFNLNIIFKELI
jgi:hypothetical protein